jgi:hypothetical protein
MTTTPNPVPIIDGYVTLAGLKLSDALAKLDEKLDPKAYKKVNIGGKQLTDISPAYSLEVISNLFGPLGIGWGYTVESETTHDHSTSGGKHYKGYTLFGTIWYLVDDGSGTHVRVEWPSYGGNSNAGSGADEHFSAQGAVTNLIGKGWSMQGFQRTIYKGEDFIDPPADPQVEVPTWRQVVDAYEAEGGHRKPVMDMLGKPTSGEAALEAWNKLSDTEKVTCLAKANGTIK